jgi:hypothetical protein
MMPDENLLNIPQKQAVVEIEGDDDIHEWKLELSKNPNFMTHEKDGEIIGKGYIELTSERKLGFEFLLLPDMAWNKLGYYGPPKFQ